MCALAAFDTRGEGEHPAAAVVGAEHLGGVGVHDADVDAREDGAPEAAAGRRGADERRYEIVHGLGQQGAQVGRRTASVEHFQGEPERVFGEPAQFRGRGALRIRPRHGSAR
ncbi:hypothetical protein GS495_09525 [Rhodococcus hoagii]|nr:hypothetical protein [Prescottella equi]